MSGVVLLCLYDANDAVSRSHREFAEWYVREHRGRCFVGESFSDAEWDCAREADLVVVLGHGSAGGPMNANCEGTGSVLDGVTIGRELSAKAVYLLACEAGTRSNDETAMANKVVDACSARCLAHAGVVEVARVFNDLPDDGANGDHTKHLYGTTMLRNAFVELIHSFRDGANEPRAIVEVIDKMIAEIEPDLPADPGPFAETRLAWSTVIRKNFRSLIIQSK